MMCRWLKVTSGAVDTASVSTSALITMCHWLKVTSGAVDTASVSSFNYNVSLVKGDVWCS